MLHVVSLIIISLIICVLSLYFSNEIKIGEHDIRSGIAGGISAFSWAIINSFILDYKKASKTLLADKSSTIAIVYLNKIKHDNIPAKILTISCSIFSAWYFFYVTKNEICVSAFMANTLIFTIIEIKEFVIGYRIQKGYFGTNRSEARELVLFMLKNSSNIDFNNDNGEFRKVLFSDRHAASLDLRESQVLQ